MSRASRPSQGNKPVSPVTGQRFKSLMSWSVAVVLTVMVLGAGWHFSRPEVSPIRDVEVQGAFDYLTGPEVEQAVVPHLGDGFWLLDVDEVRRSLRSLAWVREAQVQRIWPDRLVVSLTEQSPQVVWRQGGYLNELGERFDPGSQARHPDTRGMVVLGGPEGSEQEVMEAYRTLLSDLERDQTDVALISLNTDQRRAWRVSLNNGLELNLGREDLKGRFERFLAVYRQVLSQRVTEVAHVDLRYSNGVAVSWKAAQSTDTEGG